MQSSKKVGLLMIIKEGREYILKSKDGKKVLGRHKNKEDALAQERAILISKSRRNVTKNTS